MFTGLCPSPHQFVNGRVSRGCPTHCAPPRSVRDLLAASSTLLQRFSLLLLRFCCLFICPALLRSALSTPSPCHDSTVAYLVALFSSTGTSTELAVVGAKAALPAPLEWRLPIIANWQKAYQLTPSLPKAFHRFLLWNMHINTMPFPVAVCVVCSAIVTPRSHRCSILRPQH
jgi:hypothetical protein